MTAGFPKGAIKGKARGSCSALYNLAREVKESHHILLDTWVSPSQCARGHSGHGHQDRRMTVGRLGGWLPPLLMKDEKRASGKPGF